MENEPEKVVSTATTDAVRSKFKTVWDAERAMYTLLSDHPYFVENVSKIRKRLGIPRDGFTDGQRAYDWEHARKTNAKTLWDAAEKLTFEFTIKPAFRSEAKFFTKDYIVSPKIVEYQLSPSETSSKSEIEELQKHAGRYKIGARVIQTGNEIENRKYQFRANALYVEITQHTTFRDVVAAMKNATRRKKEMLPFSIPKTNAATRFAWQLFTEKKNTGMSDAQIAKTVNKRFSMHLTAQHVPSYARRYEKILQTLKPFRTK